MAQLEHGVVGGVHHIVDRSLTERLQALPEPIGRRRHLYAANHPRRVASAKLGRLDLDARHGCDLFRSFLQLGRHRLQPQAIKRSHLASDAVVAQAVGTIDGEVGIEQRPGGRLFDAADVNPGEREARAHLRRRRGDVHELLQPVVKYLHRFMRPRASVSSDACAAYGNWRRKRTSFWKKTWISFRAYLSMANRSTPRPKAKPEKRFGSYFTKP